MNHALTLLAAAFLCIAAGEPDMLMRTLLERGEKTLEARDISAARKLLEPPAAHGNAEAARCLAQTYDPTWLVAHGIFPVELFANLEKAWWLYQEASAGGDEIAIKRFAQAN